MAITKPLRGFITLMPERDGHAHLVRHVLDIFFTASQSKVTPLEPLNLIE